MNSFILDIELVDDRCTFLKGIVSNLLPLHDIIHLVAKGGQDTDRTLAIEIHSVENLAKILHVSALQTLCNRQYSTVDILRYELLEFLSLHASDTGERIDVRSHLHQQLAEGSSSHFIAKHILIHDSTKAHDLSLSKPHLLAETSNTGGKVHQITGRSRRVLGQFIDGRACGQHCTTKSHSLVSTKRHGQLTYILHSILAQIVTKSHIDLICSIDELHDSLLALNTQTAGITSQLIQTFPRSARVQLLELLVHFMDLLGGLTSVLPHIFHLLIHGSARLHPSSDCE